MTIKPLKLKKMVSLKKIINRPLAYIAVGLLSAVVLMSSLPMEVIAAPKSAAWINARYPSAAATFSQFDTQCINNLQSMGSAPYSRAQINASGPYPNPVWISDRNNPTITTINLGTGVTSVPLRINMMTFICAQLVNNSNGGHIDGNARVTTGNFPNERSPNPDTSAYATNQASIWRQNNQITGLQVISGGGGISGFSPNQIMRVSRENDSRYWFSPQTINFNYTRSATAGSATVVIRMHYKSITDYHAFPPGGVSQCILASNGQNATVGADNFGPCRQHHHDLVIQINAPSFSTGIDGACTPTPRIRGRVNQSGTYDMRIVRNGVEQTPDTYTDGGATYPNKRSNLASGVWHVFELGPSRYSNAASYRIKAFRQGSGEIVFSGTINLGPCPPPEQFSNVGSIRYRESTNTTNITTAAPGETISIRYQVCNTGTLTLAGPKNRGTAPSVRRWTSGDINPGLDSTQNIAADGCRTNTYTHVIPNTATGQLCTRLRANKERGYSNNTGLVGSVDLTRCIDIVRRPYISVYGGDLHAGTVISPNASTACTTTAGGGGRTIRGRVDSSRGSRGQYAVSATGSITTFGSNNSPTSNVQTYGNTGTAGNFYRIICRPDYSQLTPSVTLPAGTYNAGSLASTYSGQIVLINGNAVINGAAITGGNRVTVIVTGNARVDSNIGYKNLGTQNPNYTNRQDIPAFALVTRGNLVIHPNVSRLDGLYISNQIASTCGTNHSNLVAPSLFTNSNACNNNILTVYGMLIGQQIHLRRLYGNAGTATAAFDNPSNFNNSNRSTGLAGEFIRLSAELYLAPPPGFTGSGDGTGGDSSTRPIYQADLPPLF